MVVSRLSELIDKYKSCIITNKRIKYKIYCKVDEIEEYKEVYKAVKVAANINKIAGGFLMALSPFTGGVTAPFGIGILGTGVAGNVLMDVINSFSTKEFFKEIDNYNSKRKNDLSELREIVGSLGEIIAKYQGIDKELAVNSALYEFHTGTICSPNILKKFKVFRTDSLQPIIADPIIQQFLLLGTAFTAAGLVSPSLFKTLPDALGVGTECLGVVGAIWGAIDLGKLTAEWKNPHEASIYGNLIQKNIELQNEEFEKMVNILTTERERIDTILSTKVVTEVEEEEEEECICRPFKVPVLYANMQSMRPEQKSKMHKFQSLMQQHKPQIVALVETWLTRDIDTKLVKEKWGLNGYEIFRFDRQDSLDSADAERKGGGMIVAWNPNNCSGFIMDNPSKIFNDLIVNWNDALQTFNIHRYQNCSICNNGKNGELSYSFRVFYRRPGPYQKTIVQKKECKPMQDICRTLCNHVIFVFGDFYSKAYTDYNVKDQELKSLIQDLLSIQRLSYLFGSSKGVVVGDFNWTEEEANNCIKDAGGGWDRPSLGQTSKGGGCPDMVIGTPGFVEDVQVLDYLSDHKPIFFFLNLSKDYHEQVPCQKCERDMLAGIWYNLLYNFIRKVFSYV